jgi:hypothetical protein
MAGDCLNQNLVLNQLKQQRPWKRRPILQALMLLFQVKFLFATIDKCWALLQPGGFLVIQSMLCKVFCAKNNYAKRVHSHQEILPYIAWVCPGSWYVGVIAVQTSGKRNKPLWVWRKMGITVPSPVRFEDAVAVWGYRVRSMARRNVAALLMKCFAGFQPNFHYEKVKKVTMAARFTRWDGQPTSKSITLHFSCFLCSIFECVCKREVKNGSSRATALCMILLVTRILLPIWF